MGFRRFAEGLAGWMEWLGIFGMLFILAVTVVDVVGAKLFLHPLKAATELVGFAQIVAIGSALASCLFVGRHIVVEFFLLWLPKAVRPVVVGFASVLGLAFFALLAWQSYLYGLSLSRAGEISSTARIPLYPFAYLLAIFSVAAALFFLGEILGLGGRGAKHEPH